MNRRPAFAVLLSLTLAAFSGLFAQETAPRKNSLIRGEVISLATSAIGLKTDAGDVRVSLAAATKYMRVPADNLSPKAATPSEFSAMKIGDKLLVSGLLADDKKTIAAATIYLVSSAELAEHSRKESERWVTRGVSGKVTAVDAATGQITVESRGLMGSTKIVVTPKSDATFRRYAPNSVKYSEAVASTAAEITVGDMLRAVGDRSADGASFAAEEILTGAFQTVAGTVKSIDAAKEEIVITDLQTNKDVTIALASANLLKRFPAEMAERMAQFQAARAAGGPTGPPAGGRAGGPPQGQRPEGQPGQDGGRRFGGGGQRGGIDEMLDRFPDIKAADLKPGEMIAVSSTKGTDPTHISAIKLLAGVEPFIRVAQAQNTGRQQGRGSQNGGFSIPGLDGIDIP
jgi:hypothetical protein